MAPPKPKSPAGSAKNRAIFAKSPLATVSLAPGLTETTGIALAQRPAGQAFSNRPDILSSGCECGQASALHCRSILSDYFTLH
jgi:hypothetical protein